MASSNFKVVRFNAHLGDNPNDIKGFPDYDFHGDSVTEWFTIDGFPTRGSSDTCYLLVNGYDVQDDHQIMVNGTPPLGPDLPHITRANYWMTWMAPFSATAMRHGSNSIRIERKAGGDNFLVSHIAVHWKEANPYVQRVMRAVRRTSGRDEDPRGTRSALVGQPH